MAITGGCYCKGVRYAIDAAPQFKGMCHCRECQHIAGGGANYFMVVGPEAFKYTQGAPKAFRRSDLENPVTREFCPECGAHLVTRAQGGAMVIVKVGSLDAPAEDFGMPQVAIWTSEKQPYHAIPDGVAQFAKFPG
jgi:hypothetical protein